MGGKIIIKLTKTKFRKAKWREVHPLAYEIIGSTVICTIFAAILWIALFF